MRSRSRAHWGTTKKAPSPRAAAGAWRFLEHIRCAPYHPMTRGKIERFYRSVKNVIKLRNFHCPWKLERGISEFVDCYNHHRHHDALNNMIPADA